MSRTAKQSESGMTFETDVITGEALAAMVRGARVSEPRDALARLETFLHSDERDRVCLLHGLFGTGKKTLMRQALDRMTPEDFRRAAYVKVRRSDTMVAMERDLKKLFGAGFRFVFVDEVTLMEDFIDSASLFSDVYAAMGMKIVLAGTDSLGFELALRQELYDRARAISTTFVPYREWSRLSGVDNADEYIRRGGLLGIEKIRSDSADVESAGRYLDEAVCANIGRSLSAGGEGWLFRHLRTLCKTGALPAAVRSVLGNQNLRFLLPVLQTLRNTEFSGVVEMILRQLTERPDGLGRGTEYSGVEVVQSREIRDVLISMDLIAERCVETTNPNAEPSDEILYTQPWLRYGQVRALLRSLLSAKPFDDANEEEKDRVFETILDAVRGRLLKDVVLLESLKTADSNHSVFRLEFEAEAFDMVIYDRKENACEVFEIANTRERTAEVYRALFDPEKCRRTEARFGPIRGRYVLYRDDDFDLPEVSVRYRNVENFLKTLPTNKSLRSV